jgi:nucleotide sugar dehydrogenase
MTQFELNNYKVGIIGLGYVGLPLAIQLGKNFSTIGFDINLEKVKKLQNGESPIDDIEDAEIQKSQVKFTNNSSNLANCNIYIVAVPTPIDCFNNPLLNPLEKASEIVGINLSQGNIVIYESTVYPGVTEEVCVPILEKFSKLKLNLDFGVGYSPERINPSDKIHTINKITKIVSVSNQKFLNMILKIYTSFIEEGIYVAPTIKVAEAAKILENTQRDVNIALVNEFSILLHKLGIDTKEVLKAAKTKWNFLDFKPGFVGGHCIGVDPYYMIYKSHQVGFVPSVMIASRNTNNEYTDYVVNQIIKKIIKTKLDFNTLRVGILGVTFKENCADTRNSKVIEMIQKLREFGIEPNIYDPLVTKDEMLTNYNLEIEDEILGELDVLILAVPHNNFCELKMIMQMFDKNKTPKVFFDLKCMYDKSDFSEYNIEYWRP